MPTGETLQVLLQLVENGLLLAGLALLFIATNFDPQTSIFRKKIVAGLIIGATAWFIIANPWVFGEGLIFDTRSVLFAIAGLYFGWLPTLIGAAIAVTYRLTIGGGGVYAGVLTIINTAALGLFWPKLRRFLPFKNIYLDQYLLGLIAHIITLLGFFTIPNSWAVISQVWIAYLVIFPVITMLLGVVINNQHERILMVFDTKKQKRLLQAAVDSTHTMEMYAVDRQYRYLTFNEFHRASMKKYYQVDIQQGMVFTDVLKNNDMTKRFIKQIDAAFEGQHLHEQIEVEDTPGKFLEIQYTPIRDDRNAIIGATIFLHDVTARVQGEKSILHMSYHDALTGLGNRRYYDETLKKMNHEQVTPVSVILCDVNGLKMMNDAFGHDAGDELLIQVARELQSSFGHDGYVFRVGGDEFVALLPKFLLKDAIAKMEIVRVNLANLVIRGMNVSVSYGTGIKLENESIEEIIRIAEETMYRHKLFEVSSHRSESIKAILNTLHEKNPREHQHSERVSRICSAIGHHLAMSEDELRLLTAISNLHDIGKIAIDERILNKPSKLDDKEWEIIKTHPEIGYRIISTAPEYAEIAEDILSHHERYDGTGYPRGIKGKDIPLRVRIISIADAYDAMISERPYRKPLTHVQAIDEIRKGSGTQFDPELVRLFLEMDERGELG